MPPVLCHIPDAHVWDHQWSGKIKGPDKNQLERKSKDKRPMLFEFEFFHSTLLRI